MCDSIVREGNVPLSNNELIKPMLAAEYENNEGLLIDLIYPVLGMPKIDGIRGMVQNKILYSRALKPIPNEYTQSLFGQPFLHGFDGELVVGSPNGPDVQRRTVSGVMSKAGYPNVHFYIFDLMIFLALDFPYCRRYECAQLLISRIKEINPNLPISLIPYTELNSEEELLAFEQKCLSEGYEGIIIRTLSGTYWPNKRASFLNGGLIKKKLYKDSEARIIGFLELYMKGNVPGNTLGKLIVEDIYTKQQFKVGTGYTNEERKHIWENKDIYLNKLIKYKYFPIGIKDKPRHPVFLAFRHEHDL